METKKTINLTISLYPKEDILNSIDIIRKHLEIIETNLSNLKDRKENYAIDDLMNYAKFDPFKHLKTKTKDLYNYILNNYGKKEIERYNEDIIKKAKELEIYQFEDFLTAISKKNLVKINKLENSHRIKSFQLL